MIRSVSSFTLSLLTTLSFTSFCFAKAPLVEFGNLAPHLNSLPFNFKIVDWNVYKGGRKGMADDFSQLSKEADIALFQESYETPNLVLEISKANPELSWTMVRGFVYQGYYTGVATGSRVEALRVEGFLTNVHEPILNSPKTMLLSVYPLANSIQNLTVLNVHGINFVLNSKYKKQVQQMIEILKDQQGPVLVAGDFNTWNEGRLRYLDEGMKTLGLHRLVLQNEDASKLDHAYVRGLQVTEASLIKQVNSSDHKPMILKFNSRSEETTRTLTESSTEPINQTETVN